MNIATIETLDELKKISSNVSTNMFFCNHLIPPGDSISELHDTIIRDNKKLYHACSDDYSLFYAVQTHTNNMLRDIVANILKTFQFIDDMNFINHLIFGSTGMSTRLFNCMTFLLVHNSRYILVKYRLNLPVLTFGYYELHHNESFGIKLHEFDEGFHAIPELESPMMYISPVFVEFTVTNDMGIADFLWHIDDRTFPVLGSDTVRKSECQKYIYYLYHRYNHSDIILYRDVISYGMPSTNNSGHTLMSLRGHNMETCPVPDDFITRWNTGDDEKFNIKMQYHVDDIIFKTLYLVPPPNVGNAIVSNSLYTEQNLDLLPVVSGAFELMNKKITSVMIKDFDDKLRSVKTFTDSYGTCTAIEDSAIIKYYNKMRNEL